MRKTLGGSLVLSALFLATLMACATKPPAMQGQAASIPLDSVEPIPLDTKDPRYAPYLDKVREMIKAKWGYPCVQNPATNFCDYKSARLVIQFGILKNGRPVQLLVVQPSDYEIYDRYAMDAIRQASPFPPVPPELMALAAQGSAGIRILAAFRYVSTEAPPVLRQD